MSSPTDDFLFKQAIAHYQDGQLPEAESICRKILQAKPDNAEALNLLGKALRDTGRFEQAIACFQTAISVKPDNPAGHYWLGDALATLGHLDQAIASISQAIRLKPDEATAFNRLGIVWKEKGEIGKAIFCYQRAAALKPDFADAYYNLGLAWRDRGEVERAIAAFRQALVFKPDDIRTLYLLSDSLAASGRFEEANAIRFPESSLPSAPPANLPFIGDRVVLLACPPSVRRQLQRIGIEVTELTAASPESFTSALNTTRNRAAMSGNPCCLWVGVSVPPPTHWIRQIAGDDLIEIAAESADDFLRKIASHAVPPPDTSGQVFAVCSIRNGSIELLPHWLEHHTRLGVDRILLGLFDDISPQIRGEIDICAARWPVTYFSQSWKGTSENAQEEQRRSACRQAGARPDTWTLHADLDEFLEFPAPLAEIIAAADAQRLNAVSGWLLDRVAADGSFPPIRPAPPSLFEQFPISRRLTSRILLSGSRKIMLAHYAIPVIAGHHFSARATQGKVPIGKPEQYLVHHFKWHAGLLSRLQWSLSQPNTNPSWRIETERFLKWLDANGGRIPLDESTS
jgi:Flp pilus assembly protein TadD